MAKRQVASKLGGKTAAPKKSARGAGKSRKSAAAKSAPAKSASTKAAAAPAAKAPRRRQRVAISHYREQDFVADGLRAYARYRDLGIAAASGGQAQAHVIRLIGPCVPAEVSKLHYHDAEFQLVYVLNGTVSIYFEGEGEVTMKQGSSWTQPPRVKHLIRSYSDNCELLEVVLPAEFRTIEVKA
ncbi:MAG: hypothetical protein JWR89_3311 [Tardiphaga sp.]|jgi:mannose-6-phosphate isomerase-like protein (cupin superfamily)|uniref:cupin domain-containing protein n=1 Tax=Tardiphaga sp. TaxID=1926292 RepID=UPI00260AF634|nr:cupin domain-containing protein [Tardiphaga sp.]MDB5503409.1 hypothetical protein [Tardiphaga sp.]